MAFLNNIHCNPFELQTARSQWTNTEQNFPLRVLRSCSGAVYDIFIKNPYELSIGNGKRLFSSQNTYTKIEKAAGCVIILLGTLYSIILAGAATALAGKGITAAGAGIGISQITTLGKCITSLGERIFLTGAVPLYGGFYVLPHKIFQLSSHVICKAANSILKISTKYLRFLSDKIEIVADWIFSHALLPLWNKVLNPIIKLLNFPKVFSTISKILEFTANKIGKVVDWEFNHLLLPFTDKVTVPVLDKVFTAIEWALDTTIDVFQLVYTKVEIVARLAFNSILAPLWSKILVPAWDALANSFFIPMSSSIVKTITFVGNFSYKVVNNVAESAGIIFKKIILQHV
jgi:hypothetical protein